MGATVFINYVNGVHHNDWEQQRRILSHASKQKRSNKNGAPVKKDQEFVQARPPVPTNCVHGRKECPHSNNESCPCELSTHLGSHSQQARSLPMSDGAIGGVGFEPFSALPVSGLPGAHEVLEYLLHYYAFRIQPLQRALGCEQELTKLSFATAMASPEYLFAAMANGCADYEMQKNKAIAREPSQRVLLFRGQALRTLSAKLKGGSQAVDVGSVMAITLLMSMDIAYGDAQPVLLHRRALRRMLELPPQPGRKKLGWWLEHENLADYTSGYLSDEPPSWWLAPGETFLSPYPFARRKPLQYPNSCSAEVCGMTGSIPEGFRTMALQGYLSVEILQIIERIFRVLRILEKARQRTINTKEVDFITAYKAEHEFHTCIDCLRRIAPAYSPSEEQTTSIEHVVCLALVAFCNSLYGCMTYGTLFKAVLDSLDKAIRDCILQQGLEECVIWAQLVSVWAVSINAGTQSEMNFDTMMRIRRQYGNGLGWGELNHVIQSFLWTQDMADICEMTWKRVSLVGDRSINLGVVEWLASQTTNEQYGS